MLEHRIDFPKVYIFKTTIDKNTSGRPNQMSDDDRKIKYESEIVLALDKSSSTHLISLSSGGSTSTEPTTCSMSFILGIEDLQTRGFSENQISKLDIRYNDIIPYNIMDHFEVMYTDGNTDASGETSPLPPEEKKILRRIFMGIVRGIHSEWTPGVGLKVDITGSGLFYWLDLMKVQPKVSLFEYMLRNQDNSTQTNQGRLLAYNTKYDGKTIPDIINKILFQSEETQYIFLQQYNINDVFGVLSKGASLNVTDRDMQAQIDAQTKIDVNAYSGTGDSIKASAAEGVLNSNKKSLDLVLKDTKEAITYGQIFKAKSESQTAANIAQNKQVQKTMGMYWDFQSLRLLKDNSISIYTEQANRIVAFPVSLNLSHFINGSYNSRLEFLRNISGLSFYEIYQTPQGTTYVKPPLYNSVPIASIDPVELYSVSSDVNTDNILTSVTTTGLLTAGNSKNQEIKEVAINSNFPYIQGAYTCLYPKELVQYASNSGKDSTAVTLNISCSSYEEMQNRLVVLAKKNEQREFPVIVSVGNSRKTFTFKTNTGTPTFEDSKGSISAEKYLKKVALYNFLLNYNLQSAGISDDVTTSNTTSEAYWLTLQDSMLLIKDHILLTLNVPKLRGKIEKMIYNQLQGGALLSEAKRSVYDYVMGLDVYADKQVLEEDSLWNTLDRYILGEFQPSTISGDSKASISSKNKDDKHTTQTLDISVFNDIFRVSPKIIVNFSKSDLPEIQPGEYNILQHGIHDTNISNNLVRTPKEAIAFSRFYLYKNNVSVETVKFTLKTIRTDIIPGFNVLNMLDNNVYYVQSINYNISIGGSKTTELTCVARRRPIWLKYTSVKTEDGIIDEKVKDYPMGVVMNTLYGMATDADLLKRLTFVREPGSNYKFLGWECYGVPLQDETNTEYFLPLYGSPTFSASDNPSTGDTTSDNLNSLTYMFSFPDKKAPTASEIYGNSSEADISGEAGNVNVFERNKEHDQWYFSATPTAKKAGKTKNSSMQLEKKNTTEIKGINNTEVNSKVANVENQYAQNLDDLASLDNFLIIFDNNSKMRSKLAWDSEQIMVNGVPKIGKKGFNSAGMPNASIVTSNDKATLKDLLGKLTVSSVVRASVEESLTKSGIAISKATMAKEIGFRKQAYIETIINKHMISYKTVKG